MKRILFLMLLCCAVFTSCNDNSTIGIIGGADGPTSIFIGTGNDTSDNNENVGNFYIDEAIKLTAESGKLASDKEFISYYTASEDMTNKVLDIGAVDYSKPTGIYRISANREQIIENIKALSGEEFEEIDVEKLLKLNKVDFTVIGNLINASYGAENLAALTILTNSKGYIMPNDFTHDFALFLKYDSDYSSLVSFSEFGDGVIKATMSFVNNGEKDNIFMRIDEITESLGENSIEFTQVK